MHGWHGALMIQIEGCQEARLVGALVYLEICKGAYFAGVRGRKAGGSCCRQFNQSDSFCPSE